MFRLALAAFLTPAYFTVWQCGRLFIRRSAENELKWRNSRVGAWARALARTAGMDVSVTGEAPTAPFFLVCNHLSYMDIIALSVATDCVFVAKREIAGWPGVGRMALAIGTIFIDRANYQDLPRVISKIEQALAEGKGIILFAEGTSGQGDRVLPFSSALLEPAARLGVPVSYASIRYETPPNEMPAYQAVSWWGNMTLLPHLRQLLKVPAFTASIRFGSDQICLSDRKELSRRLWTAVSESFVPMVDSSEQRTSITRSEGLRSGPDAKRARRARIH
jgi:1-acyl-sn-glycerol-3-phosphate acyltransferase